MTNITADPASLVQHILELSAASGYLLSVLTECELYYWWYCCAYEG